MKRLLVMAVWCSILTGCTTVADVTRVLIVEPHQFPTYCDHKWTLRANRRLAREFLFRRLNHDGDAGGGMFGPFLGHEELPVPPDYADGYVEGFADHLTYGGAGLPPLAPPRKYWRLRYANPEGHAAIQAWYAGFTDGSADALQSGIRDTRLVPTFLQSSDELVLQRDGPDRGRHEGEELLPPPADPGIIEEQPIYELPPDNGSALSEPTPAIRSASFPTESVDINPTGDSSHAAEPDSGLFMSQNPLRRLPPPGRVEVKQKAERAVHANSRHGADKPVNRDAAKVDAMDYGDSRRASELTGGGVEEQPSPKSMSSRRTRKQ